MKWSETEKFTWDELSNFTWDEIKLEAEELTALLRGDNRELPFSVTEKLLEICNYIPEAPTKIWKGMKLSDLCNFLIWLIRAAETIEAHRSTLKNVISIIKNFIH